MTTDGGKARERRVITDPRAMRAMAHPLRLSLLEAIRREGTLTATRAAELLDDSPGNVSWHLQTLARYGFIEEAGGGRGRSRPWRAVAIGEMFDVDDVEGDAAAAGEALEMITNQRNTDRLHEWWSRRRTYAPPWRRAGFMSASTTYLTVDELDRLEADIRALIDQYQVRLTERDQRPEGAQPVRIVTFGHPLPPTPSGN